MLLPFFASKTLALTSLIPSLLIFLLLLQPHAFNLSQRGFTILASFLSFVCFCFLAVCFFFFRSDFCMLSQHTFLAKVLHFQSSIWINNLYFGPRSAPQPTGPHFPQRQEKQLLFKYPRHLQLHMPDTWLITYSLNTPCCLFNDHGTPAAQVGNRGVFLVPPSYSFPIQCQSWLF